MGSYAASWWLYYISWWAMWIGHIIAFSPAALMWIPAYFSTRVAMIYGMTWLWAMGIFGITFIFTWTTLLVDIINWPSVKEMQVTFVLYTVNAMVFGGAMMKAAFPAAGWYMRDMDCERDEDGNCIEDEGFDW